MRRPAILIAVLVLSSTVGARPLPAAAASAAADQTQVQAVADAAPLPPFVLRPFAGTYQVFRGQKPLGQAVMRLVNTGGARWRVDLGIQGTQGLAGAAGVNIQQSTVFEVLGGQYRPITQSTVRHALFATRKTVGAYDWAKGIATWSGDVKKSRRGREIALQAGDMSGLLINLAVMRDAQPGATLTYRFVDDSRSREHRYQVSQATENVRIGEIGYDAWRIERGAAGGDRTVVWYTPEVPLPVRIHLQDGDDAPLDLMLIQYKGV
ncbi:DUF3108 domain-containing protein [Luteimonas sp. e5]